MQNRQIKLAKNMLWSRHIKSQLLTPANVSNIHRTKIHASAEQQEESDSHWENPDGDASV